MELEEQPFRRARLRRVGPGHVPRSEPHQVGLELAYQMDGDVPGGWSMATSPACARCWSTLTGQRREIHRHRRAAKSLSSSTQCRSRNAGEPTTNRPPTPGPLPPLPTSPCLRHGHRHPARAEADRLFQAFSQVDASTDPPLWRHRAGAGHQPPPVRADGRRHVGGERGLLRPGHHLPLHHPASA